jgi:hypothetical protein
MLSSDNAGEADNARRAIDRILKKHKLDWHDLTAAALGSTTPTWTDVKPTPRKPWWQVMADEVIDSEMKLTDKEESFITDMTEWRNEPSEKQQAWLKKLRDRAEFYL